MNSRWSIGLAGGFGGVAPTVFGIAAGLAAGKAQDWKVLEVQCLGFLVLGALGAGTALIHKEKSLVKAFFLGVGLPALLQKGLSGATADHAAQATQASADQHAEVFWLATPAYAEPPVLLAQAPAERVPSEYTMRQLPAARLDMPAVQYQRNRKLVLKLGGVPDDTEAVFSSGAGHEQTVVPLKPKGDGSKVEIQIPDFATQVVLRAKSRSAVSEPVSLAEAAGSSSTFTVQPDERLWQGLLQALGSQKARPFGFEVKAAPPQSP